MSLPLLPAFNFNPNVGRTTFNLRQRFFVANKDVHYEADDSPRQPKLYSRASYAVRPETFTPAWKAFDKEALCFDAVFHESLEYVSQLEENRFRYCKIYYFLEDDTMQIAEPLQRNSGIPQGITVKRHHFKKPPSNFGTEEFYTFYDLNVNICLEIYGRIYKITDCDKFTRKFLTDFGMHINDPVPQPIDPYSCQRSLMDKGHIMKTFPERRDKLGQFLDYHPQVLRFYCFWDDTCNLHGVKWKFVLHYYLDDDTVEVIEKREPNSGHSLAKKFLMRSRLPKKVEPLPNPGEITDTTLLNLSGARGKNFIFNRDFNPVPEREIMYYTHGDLDLGIIINVYGRPFLLYDCDEFTKAFYRLRYNKELVPVELPKEMKVVPIKEIYPQGIFGDPEDTIQNCLRVIPKPYTKDALKFFVHDKYGFDSGQFTFDAKLITDDLVKKSRSFVIIFYLCDDTFQINEPQKENTGLVYGMFMARAKLIKPESKFKKDSLPDYYSAQDFFVGNVLKIKGENFLLTRADEYTYDYMEKHPDQFVHSNIEEIKSKLRKWFSGKLQQLKSLLQSFDQCECGFVSYDNFRKGVLDFLPERIPEHEIITLARHYAALEGVDIRYQDVLSIVQSELSKANYNEFDNLNLALQEFDTDKTGCFTPEELFLHLRANNLPVSPDMLKAFLDKFPRPNYNSVDYLCVLHAFNYLKNPVPAWVPVPDMYDINWRKVTTRKSLGNIKFMDLVKDLN